MNTMRIGNRLIGEGQPCFLIAEIGINHNGDMDVASEMVRAAAEAGADAVKFQNYRTEDFLTDHSLTYTYTSQGQEVTESQFAMFKRSELAAKDLELLKRSCDRHGVLFFSTPTNTEGVDALVQLNAACLKNGSDYLGHLPLIRQMARSGLPTILSTGMATEEEVAEAVDAFRGAGGKDLVLLACTSSYPTPPEAANLSRIPALARRFNCLAGFSDHTEGWKAAVGSVCLSACMIEKHFTTDRSLPGPDQRFSSDPAEFADLVRQVREMELMLGRPELHPTLIEGEARQLFRLSCIADRDLLVGDVVNEEDIAFRRPANGLPPSQAEALIGKTLKLPIKRGEPFQWEHVRQ